MSVHQFTCRAKYILQQDSAFLKIADKISCRRKPYTAPCNAMHRKSTFEVTSRLKKFIHKDQTTVSSNQTNKLSN